MIFDQVRQQHPITIDARQEPHPMTDAPAEHPLAAVPETPPPSPPVSAPYLTRMHVDLASAGVHLKAVESHAERLASHVADSLSALGPAFNALVALAEDPVVREFVDRYLSARNAGVADEVFHAALDLMETATRRKAPTGPQPAQDPPTVPDAAENGAGA